MKVVFALFTTLAVAYGSQQMKQHYSALHSMLHTSSEALESPMLTQVLTHVQLTNPMQTIADTCTKMRVEIRAERNTAIKNNQADKKVCEQTQESYRQQVRVNALSEARYRSVAANEAKAYNKIFSEPKQLNTTRVAMAGSIKQQEVVVARGQANRVHVHSEFLKLKSAFHYAMGNISLISRVLNGEGSLGDLHGRPSGLLEKKSCSAHLADMSAASTHPVVAGMLQLFSKSVHKVEGTAKNAVASSASGDMDAVNTLLAKVRENLIKSLNLATDQENKLITMWKSEKRSKRKALNNDWLSYYENFKKQGNVEAQIGEHWEKEGHNFVSATKHLREKNRYSILNGFLTTRCKKSRMDFAKDMTNKANELNALDKVVRYLKENVFPKWSKKIVDVVSTPYTWAVEEPRYVTVSNTYSSVGFSGNDPTVCKQDFSTLFSKVRVLKTTGGRFYLDPNDLTHSENYDFKRKNKLKGSPQCQLFATGIPVGRAHSCSKSDFATAKVDLTGTPYSFGKAATHMFAPLGRKTAGSSATATSGGKVLNLKIRGRCGDLYGDDAGAEMADYRSDPIPLETQPMVKSGR